MKIWKEFNSSHSNNITIIGEFKDAQTLNHAFDMIEDFTLASWEERYPSVEDFKKYWSATFPNMLYTDVREEEFITGIDNEPDIEKNGNVITISRFRNDNLGGLIKILRHGGARKITIDES